MSPGGSSASPAELVSAVVLNWNGGDDLLRAVSSLEAQTHRAVEIIVVDNGSRDGSLERLAEVHPGAVIVRLGRNTGYCHGNNAGLARTRGCWLLFLNCDAWLEPDFLERALEAARGRSQVGLVAGKVLRDDGRTLDTAGQYLTAARHVVDRGYGEPDRGQYDEPGEVPGVCGAVALVSRALVEDVAPDGELFDETFFAFSEDADLGWRARRRGWKTAWVPAAVARHRRSGSAGPRRGLGRFFALMARDDTLAFHIVKNRFLMILKNEPAWGLVARLPLYLAHDVPRLLALALLRPRVLWRVLTAWPSYRQAWSKRRAVGPQA